MTDNTDLLFVYGTLRHGCANREASRLHLSTDYLGPARIRGRLYRVDWYPGFIADPQAGWVKGDLFRMRDAAAVLAALDRYEEAGAGFPVPWEYVRGVENVENAAGLPVSAWVYSYNHPVKGLTQIASGDWLKP